VFAAYLRRGGVNVVVVDWSPMCAFPWYGHAVLNARVAARYLAAFIEYVVSRGFRLSRMHVIGFSLGAEIAGLVGKSLKIGKLPRITGECAPREANGRDDKRSGRHRSSEADFLRVGRNARGPDVRYQNAKTSPRASRSLRVIRNTELGGDVSLPRSSSETAERDLGTPGLG